MLQETPAVIPDGVKWRCPASVCEMSTTPAFSQEFLRRTTDKQQYPQLMRPMNTEHQWQLYTTKKKKIQKNM